MKSLDERLSSYVSPFEDDQELSQNELLYDEYIGYQIDAMINSIGTNDPHIYFDLYFDGVINNLINFESKLYFLVSCLKKLSKVFYLDEMVDYIDRQNLMYDFDLMISLIKYFIYQKWKQDIFLYIPPISISELKIDKIKSKLKESFLEIQNKIIENKEIHSLIQNYFKYCSFNHGVLCILKMINMDVPGFVSIQLINSVKEN